MCLTAMVKQLCLSKASKMASLQALICSAGDQRICFTAYLGKADVAVHIFLFKRQPEIPFAFIGSLVHDHDFRANPLRIVTNLSSKYYIQIHEIMGNDLNRSDLLQRGSFALKHAAQKDTCQSQNQTNNAYHSEKGLRRKRSSLVQSAILTIARQCLSIVIYICA